VTATAIIIIIPNIHPIIFSILAVFAFELPRTSKPLSKLSLAMIEKISAGIPEFKKIIKEKINKF
jgi:hypothetical protein